MVYLLWFLKQLIFEQVISVFLCNLFYLGYSVFIIMVKSYYNNNFTNCLLYIEKHRGVGKIQIIIESIMVNLLSV